MIARGTKRALPTASRARADTTRPTPGNPLIEMYIGSIAITLIALYGLRSSGPVSSNGSSWMPAMSHRQREIHHRREIEYLAASETVARANREQWNQDPRGPRQHGGNL